MLIEPGIDGDETHRVRVDRTGNYPRPGEDAADYEDAFNYPRSGEAFILDDAIEALTAIRDQLVTMRTPKETQDAERNAFEIGREKERLSAAGAARVNLNAHGPQYRERGRREARPRARPAAPSADEQDAGVRLCVGATRSDPSHRRGRQREGSGGNSLTVRP